MRADLAIDAFKREMSGRYSFGVCKEGLSALVNGLVEECNALGNITFKLNTQVKDVKGQTARCKESDYSAPHIILALHSDAIREFPSVMQRYSRILHHLKMEPLVRMYAVFPMDMSHLLQEKIVSSGRIRYIIPVNPRKGVVMISYTDGDDARYWMRKQKREGDMAVIASVMKEFRAMFSEDVKIPDPTEFRIYPWTSGCTYWLPGAYDPKKESEFVLNPRKGLYMCGESFSMRQAWIEGALEHATQLLHLLPSLLKSN